MRSCFSRRQRRDRAHVVQPVGQLDEQDAEVLGHRDEHLAHRRGLLRLLGVELEPVELGDAVDDRGDLGAELALSTSSRVTAVSSTASCSSAAAMRDVVEAEVGDDPGDGERVGDVALARLADLVARGRSAATS